MNRDRIWEMYYTEAYSAEVRRACRDRIHWLASRARGRVLDIGCSQGVLPVLLAREGHDVVGLDIEEPGIEFSRQKLSEESAAVAARVEFVLADVFAWEPDRPFDTVILGEVLEHLVNPRELVNRASMLLKSDGRLLVTVPLGWLEHHDHKQAFLPTELITLLEESFAIEEFEVAHQKICVAATLQQVARPASIEPAALLPLVEQELLQQQYRAVELTRQVQAGNALRKEHVTLQRKVKQLEKVHGEARARVAALEAELKPLRIREQERLQQLKAARRKRTPARVLRSWTAKSLRSWAGRTNRRTDGASRLPSLLQRVSPKAARLRPDKQRDANRKLSRQVYEGTYRIDLAEAGPAMNPIDRRVLHLLEYSLPYRQNGYTIRSFQLIRAQLTHGWDPVVVTKPGFPEGKPRIEGPEIIAGAPHHRLPHDRAEGVKVDLPDLIATYVNEAAPLVRALRPFVLHAASNFRNAYAAAELARNFSLPFVYEVRGLWEESGVANRTLERDGALYRNLVSVETYCMTRADAVVTLGESLKQELVRRGVPQQKIFLVPNAIDLETVEVRPPRADLRAALGLSGRFVVSYIGSVSRLERLHVLIAAMRELMRERDDIAAMIVGEGDDLDALKAHASELGVADRVAFVGRVPHADIPDYYAVTDAIACTRGDDLVSKVVTPLKPFEAMGYRKPVIGSDLPALREIIADRRTGRLVPHDQPSALAKAIAELADSPQECARLADAAYDWVRSERSWLKVTEGYGPAYAYAVDSFAGRARGAVSA